MERRIPITRKQHDKVLAHIRDQETAQSMTQRYVEAILDGVEDRPSEGSLRGVTSTNGVFEMVLDVPEPPQSE